ATAETRSAASARAVPGARAFADSGGPAHARHRAQRERLRRRLKVAASAPPTPPEEADLSLAALREAQQQLVHAHAEGLPALGDGGAVDLLARHMVDAS